MFIDDDLYLKGRQITLFEKNHPEKVELIRSVQQKVEMKSISDSDPFESMDVGALIESFQSSSEGEKKTPLKSRLRRQSSWGIRKFRPRPNLAQGISNF